MVFNTLKRISSNVGNKSPLILIKEGQLQSAASGAKKQTAFQQGAKLETIGRQTEVEAAEQASESRWGQAVRLERRNTRLDASNPSLSNIFRDAERSDHVVAGPDCSLEVAKQTRHFLLIETKTQPLRLSTPIWKTEPLSCK